MVWNDRNKYRPFVLHHFLRGNSLKLINLAAKDGWETTGQVPNAGMTYDKETGGRIYPTGITMMRRKV